MVCYLCKILAVFNRSVYGGFMAFFYYGMIIEMNELGMH